MVDPINNAFLCKFGIHKWIVNDAGHSVTRECKKCHKMEYMAIYYGFPFDYYKWKSMINWKFYDPTR